MTSRLRREVILFLGAAIHLLSRSPSVHFLVERFLQLGKGPFLNTGYIASRLLQVIDSGKLRRLKGCNPLRCLAFCRFVQPGESEFDDGFLVLGQLHPLDEAHQQFPALSSGFDEPLYQFPGPVLTADGAFF